MQVILYISKVECELKIQFTLTRLATKPSPFNQQILNNRVGDLHVKAFLPNLGHLSFLQTLFRLDYLDLSGVIPHFILFHYYHFSRPRLRRSQTSLFYLQISFKLNLVIRTFNLFVVFTCGRHFFCLRHRSSILDPLSWLQKHRLL